jgi:hypothetical protein
VRSVYADRGFRTSTADAALAHQTPGVSGVMASTMLLAFTLVAGKRGRLLGINTLASAPSARHTPAEQAPTHIGAVTPSSRHSWPCRRMREPRQFRRGRACLGIVRRSGRAGPTLRCPGKRGVADCPRTVRCAQTASRRSR